MRVAMCKFAHAMRLSADFREKTTQTAVLHRYGACPTFFRALSGTMPDADESIAMINATLGVEAEQERTQPCES
jgi:hypothetical protein